MMKGVTRFVLAGGLIVAAAQIIGGPVADWNARREGNVELTRLVKFAVPKKHEEE